MPSQKLGAEPGHAEMHGAAKLGESGVSSFAPAERVQETPLTRAEKRLLRWMAARTPAWINSDHLTVLGSVAQFLVGVSYAAARWDKRALLLATGFLVLNWLGDSLDGTLARYRNRQRPRYGFYVDHVIDSFGALFLTSGLAISGYMHPLVAMAMLVAFLLLSIEVYLATYTLGSFHLSFFNLGPTEMRIVLAIGNAALFYRGPLAHLAGREFRLFDVGGVIGATVMLLMAVVSALRHTRTLYQQERLP
jgi:phosphatidylglycerophosphate synthase